MTYYIAIDGGTTNTKVFLVADGEIKGKIVTMGAKYNKDGDGYKQEIKAAIKQLLSDNSIAEKDISKILCSGMITSANGLCELEHLYVPCGIKEMADGMYETEIPEISSIKFAFIRGVKTSCKTIEDADMMRGEETEFIGIADNSSADSVYVFPGTHSKIIHTDIMGRICDFSTEFTGELIEVISKNSILRESVDMSCSEFCEEYLLKGYNYATENGLNAAAFKVRVLGSLFKSSAAEVYSFFIGAVLSSEINNIKKTEKSNIAIVGKHPLCEATKIILNSVSDKNVVRINTESSANAAVSGMIKVYETRCDK